MKALDKMEEQDGMMRSQIRRVDFMKTFTQMQIIRKKKKTEEERTGMYSMDRCNCERCSMVQKFRSEAPPGSI